MDRFIPQETLSEDELSRSMNLVLKDGIASQAMVTFTEGIFLITFALALGANNLIIGIIFAIPLLTQLVQVIGVIFLEKVESRKKLTVAVTFFGRTTFLLFAILPFLSANLALFLLLILLTIRNSFGTLGSIGWRSWINEILPRKTLGTFFSKRMRNALLVSFPLTLAAGYFIDIWIENVPRYPLQGYSVLFLLGFLSGMIGIYILLQIPEKTRVRKGEKIPLKKLLTSPLKNSNFRNIAVFLGAWTICVNLVTPFFTVYMVQNLGYSIGTISFLLVVSLLTNIIFISLWGRIADRFSYKAILNVTVPLFILTLLLWTFTTLPSPHRFTFPLIVLIHILMGISNAGVNLSTNNILLKNAPADELASYIATNSVITSILGAFAAIIGGLFADFFNDKELQITLSYSSDTRNFSVDTFSLAQWDFFFIIGFIIGLYAVHRLILVKEEGEADREEILDQVLYEMKSEIRRYSTVVGLKNLMRFPFEVTSKVKNKLSLTPNNKKKDKVTKSL